MQLQRMAGLRTAGLQRRPHRNSTENSQHMQSNAILPPVPPVAPVAQQHHRMQSNAMAQDSGLKNGGLKNGGLTEAPAQKTCKMQSNAILPPAPPVAQKTYKMQSNAMAQDSGLKNGGLTEAPAQKHHRMQSNAIAKDGGLTEASAQKQYSMQSNAIAKDGGFKNGGLKNGGLTEAPAQKQHRMQSNAMAQDGGLKNGGLTEAPAQKHHSMQSNAIAQDGGFKNGGLKNGGLTEAPAQKTCKMQSNAILPPAPPVAQKQHRMQSNAMAQDSGLKNGGLTEAPAQQHHRMQSNAIAKDGGLKDSGLKNGGLKDSGFTEASAQKTYSMQSNAIIFSSIVDMRADILLTHAQPSVSRHHLTSRMATLHVNGKPAKISCMVRPHDLVFATMKHAARPNIAHAHVPLDILYEDDVLLVVNKASGILVHPGNGMDPSTGTLAHALHSRYPQLSQWKNDTQYRAGIVHRLDKDTSGVLVVAKNERIAGMLQQQFKNREVQKQYVAAVYGQLTSRAGEICAPVARDPRWRTRFTVANNGKKAYTAYTTLKIFDTYTMVKLFPITGRTHQLRVHLRFIRHPIVGDSRYAPRRVCKEEKGHRLLLHAQRITFTHPCTNTKHRYSAPLPPILHTALQGKLPV